LPVTFKAAASTTLLSIVALSSTFPEPLKATALAVISPVIEKSLLFTSVVAVLANAIAISALPSNDVPPIVLAVANVVAVFARAMAMFALPSKLVPPIVLAVARVVAVSAFPVKFPTKLVEVIDVAPVITPASMLITPSKTICCPASGVMFKSVPAVLEMVLPLIFMYLLK
jgi:hypothetical protein